VIAFAEVTGATINASTKTTSASVFLITPTSLVERDPP
jgi:hypothetical protein